MTYKYLLIYISNIRKKLNIGQGLIIFNNNNENWKFKQIILNVQEIIIFFNNIHQKKRNYEIFCADTKINY